MANVTEMTKVEQLYRSVYTSEPTQRLPLSWRRKDYQPSFKFTQSGLSVVRVEDSSSERAAAGIPESDQNNPTDSSNAYPIIKSDYPVSSNAGIYYYETEICSLNAGSFIVIGFSTKDAPKSLVWDSNCYGLDNRGALYHSSSGTVICPDGFKEKDIIGCGINFITNSLFFTKNGQFLGNAFEGLILNYGMSVVNPVILMNGFQTRIVSNFGEKRFLYPFLKYLSSERFIHENQLVNALSRDFIDVKMRELVAGYLVHHGYIETASSFSRWTKMGESASSPKKTRCDADLTTASTTGGEAEAETESTSAATAAEMPTESPVESFPGIGSIQHRRSIRSFCQRCKFGLAASTLNALYPKIVEKYPELILQLRCRQLIAMMHRHSVRLPGQGPTSSSSDSKLLQKQQLEEEGDCGRGSRKRPCLADTTSSEAACYVCTSGSVPTLATYDDGRAQPLVPQSQELGSSAATSCDAMDIDSTSLAPESTCEQASFHAPQLQQQQQAANKPHQVANGSETLSSAMAVFNFPDDDGEDEIDDLNKPIPMDTGSLSESASQQQQQVPPVAGSSASLNALSGDGAGDRDSLMCQIRFSRSLVDLAKDVERKKGSINPDTNRLLQDSVCLLAYEKPADPECPLRCLLDSSGRDKIASLINSAILTEEHKLPAQPNIEKILYKLERYVTATEASEAQSLAHFLLYHLSPSQYRDEMNRLVKLATEPQSPSDPPSSNNNNNNSGGAAGTNGSSVTDESFRSIEHPRSTTYRNRRLNHAVISNGTSNGTVSPPKRRSNGARRRYWRRQVPVDSTEDDGENEEDEEEVGNFSLEDEGEGVLLHRHEELEDDIEMNIEGDGEDGDSMEDEEEEVELMTASMEEDGFDDSQDGDEQEEDEVVYDPDDVEGIQQEDEEEMMQFAEWRIEGLTRLSSGRNQAEVGGSSRGGGRASTSRQGSEGASTEPFLPYMSPSSYYGRSSALDNFFPPLDLLYSSRNSRRGQQPPPSSNSGDDTTNNTNQ